MLRDEGRGYCGWVGPSCSTHNPWPVDPHPRGAGRLEPTRGRGRSRTMTTGTQRRRRSGDGGGGPVTEAPGYTARTPDSLLRGPVSTVLTSTSPPPKLSTGIVGILRFFFGVQRRCACDVSTMDTSDLPDLFPSTSPSPPGPPACPGFPSERVPQKPRHSHVSEVRKQQSSLGVRPRALHCEHNHQRSPGNTFSATQSLL